MPEGSKTIWVPESEDATETSHPTSDIARKPSELQKFYVSNGVVPKEVPVRELYTNQFVGK